MTGKIMISALISAEMYKRLDLAAQKLGKSKSQIIEEALREYLAKVGI